jgi:hypothetical protein
MIALAIVIESLFICSFIRERESRHAITDTLRPVSVVVNRGWRSSGKIGLCSGWMVRKSELDESWLYRHYGSGRKPLRPNP